MAAHVVFLVSSDSEEEEGKGPVEADDQMAAGRDNDSVGGLDSDDDSDEVHVLCSDGLTLKASSTVLKGSMLFRAILEEICPGEALMSTHTSSDTATVLEYLKHHNGSPCAVPLTPLRGTELTKLCEDAWDAAFVEKLYSDQGMDGCHKLGRLADILNIPTLVDLCAARVALVNISKTAPLVRQEAQNRMAVARTFRKKKKGTFSYDEIVANSQ